MRENPKEVFTIIAQKWEFTAAEVLSLLNSVKISNLEENKKIAFNPNNLMNVLINIEFTIKTGKKIVVLANSINSKNLHEDSLVKAL